MNARTVTSAVGTNDVTMATPLTCPLCQGRIAKGAGSLDLQCTECAASFARNPDDCFYSWRGISLTQSRSLLTNQERPINRAMTSFAVESTTEVIRRTVMECAPATIIDIGCGNGGYAQALAGCYSTYIGIEPSDIPAEKRLRPHPPSNVLLIHNDPSAKLPIVSTSIDMVLFLASYDHIPNRREVLADAYRTLKPGGFVLITMTNYGFWAKRALNFLTRRQLARAEHDHFCIHTPSSLSSEVLNTVDGTPVSCFAENVFVPNSRARFLYQNRTLLRIMNQVLRVLVRDIFRQSDSGSVMTLLFRKSVG